MKQNQFSLPESLEILERTPRVLRCLLEGLGRSWTEAQDSPESWDARGVLGHLVHGEETDWIPRATIILTSGEREPFEPFDREAQFRRFADWGVERLLDRFAELRKQNLEVLRAWELTADQLQLRGAHPELGTVTLVELLATWVAHDLSHQVQLCRTMARRYRSSVGPWSDYLPLLSR